MEFTKKVLDNGLTILHEKRDVPVTSVAIASKFGAAYELESEKGISHVIEHLCFKGTEKRNSREISSAIEGVGGVLNAFTHEELTVYYASLPSKNLGIALEVLSDIYFNPIFPEEEIKKEIGVICEEIKMRRDNPRIFVYDNIKGNLYDKPFGLSVAGSEDTIRSFDRDIILSKHRERYVPNNTIVSIVGNNSIDEILSFFKEFPFPDSKNSFDIDSPIKKISSSVVEREGISQSNLTMGFHFPSAKDANRYSALVFQSIFGEGLSSRLFLEIREKLGLVYTIKSDLDMGSSYGYLTVYAGTDKKNIDKVIEIVKNEFEKMEDITIEELNSAKEQVIGNFLINREGSGAESINLITEELFGDANNFFKFEDKINSVKIEDIRALAKNSEFASLVLNPSE